MLTSAVGLRLVGMHGGSEMTEVQYSTLVF